MSVYRTSVAVFDVPDHWHDQSIVAFRLPPAPGGGGDASFVLTKDPGKGVMPLSITSKNRLMPSVVTCLATEN